jgi:hypothetical protein
MPFTIPDAGEGDNDIQSILFQEYLEVLVAGINGLDCVLSGLAVTGGADMTPAVAKGAVLTNGVLKAIAAADVTIGAADGTNPRIDLIAVNSSGALAVRAGTAAAAPKPPARTANDVVIASVYVPAADTSIETTKITDLRVMRQAGPIQIYKTTTVETTNNTASAVHVLDKTNSGVVIPSGLFLAGKTLRCRIGGNFLLNSGTPTITLTISYGGTTMFADATITGAADADRGAWFLDFQIAAQANNDQALVGSIVFDPTIAQRVAPTTGIAGNLSLNATAANQSCVAPFAGSSAVDSDAANRTLVVTLTMSVANAANEIVTESATLEIM